MSVSFRQGEELLAVAAARASCVCFSECSVAYLRSGVGISRWWLSLCLQWMGQRGGGCTDTRFITSFLHSVFMNRSVITTARDVEETERERGRRGRLMERKELLHVVQKENNSSHPKARWGDHGAVTGKRSCVIFISQLHLWGRELILSRSELPERKLIKTSWEHYVCACLFLSGLIS